MTSPAKLPTADVPSGSIKGPIQSKRPTSATNKYKKHVTFYGMNHDTGIAELSLLEEATRLVDPNMATEDFIRGAALDAAVRLLVQVEQSKAKNPKLQGAGTTADPVHPDARGVPVEGESNATASEEGSVSGEETQSDSGNQETP